MPVFSFEKKNKIKINKKTNKQENIVKFNNLQFKLF